MDNLFLVENGADIPIFPRKNNAKYTKPSSYELYAVNVSKIKTFEQQFLSQNFSFLRNLPWKFCVANVSLLLVPILSVCVTDWYS